MRAAGARERRQQQRQITASDMLEIGDQPASSRQHRAGKAAEPIERGNIVQRFQQPRTGVARKVRCGPQDRVHRSPCQSFTGDQFACAQPGERRSQQVRRALFKLHPAGRNVASRDPEHTAHFAHRRQHIGTAGFKQGLFGQGTSSDQPDNIARNQGLRSAALLGLLRRFSLVGNRHPAARLDQPCQITFGRMRRNPAHRDRHAEMLAATGQRNIEHLGCMLGIIEKQLVKIAHPVKQQAIASLRLEREVLRHHRSGRVSGSRSLHQTAIAPLWLIREAWQPSFPLSRLHCFR